MVTDQLRFSIVFRDLFLMVLYALAWNVEPAFYMIELYERLEVSAVW